MRLYDSLVGLDELDRYAEATAQTSEPLMSGKVSYVPLPPTTSFWTGTDLEVEQKSDKMEYSVMPIDLTSKESLGVYEAPKPILVSTDSVFKRLLDYQASDTPLVNATLLNNPAVESLETVQLGSPLGNSYADAPG